ncbi:MAG: helix-turn-helix domain-containing protein [Bacteroidota bacterium]
MKKRLLLIGFLFMLGGLLSAKTVEDSTFEQAKEEVIMRQIGHQVLLHAGDSLSRVLPIKKVAPQKYQIHFEGSFSFAPDSLVAVIDRVVRDHELSNDYVVEVLNCNEQEVIYGYAISNTSQNDIIPCSSRPQPKSCYYLNIHFSDRRTSGEKQSPFVWLVFGLFLTISLSAAYLYTKNRNPTNKAAVPSQQYTIGRAVFYAEEQYLVVEEAQISLTPTEAKLLQLFAAAPNQVIEKSVIQKEIWQHDGEIISRSLDVFISKLRKKLKAVEEAQLVNVHGKGYRLEIVNS